MKRPLAWTLAALVIAAAIGATAWIVIRGEPGDGSLEASGQVRGDEITLSSRIGGVADVVAVREGQKVSKGELLVQIGARELEARLEQARAQLDVAANLVKELDAQLEVLGVNADQARMGAYVARETSRHEVHRAGEARARARAQLAASESQLERDRAAEQRFRKLLAEGFVSTAYFEEVTARFRASEANVAAARRALEEAAAGEEKAVSAGGEAVIRAKDVQRVAAERQRLLAARATATSQQQAARARVAEVEAALADTRIAAPVEATVIARLVQPGELVAPGRPVATLVDLNELHVRAFVAERDIGRVRLGDAAKVRLDAFPGRDFAARVVEVAQRAEFTPKEAHVKDERVKLVFAVKVRLDNPDGLAKPGMPADVHILPAADG